MLRIGMPQDMAPACSCTVPLGHEAALSASKDAAACQLALRHDGLYSNSVEMMAGPTWLAHPWKLQALPHLLPALHYACMGDELVATGRDYKLCYYGTRTSAAHKQSVAAKPESTCRGLVFAQN